MIRRSALNEVLAGALASGTVHTGLTADGVELTPDGVRVTLSDSTTRTGRRGDRRRRHALGGGPPPQRPAAQPVRRLHRVARHRRRGDRSGPRRRDAWAPDVECGHVPLGPDHTYWFATERAPEGRVGAAGRAGVSEDQVRVVGRAPAGAAGRDRPRRRPAQRPLRPRPGARLVEGSDRRWSATPPTRCARIWARAAAKGWRTPRSWPASSTRAAICATAFARFATFRRPRVRALVRESATIGRIVNLRPALAERRGQSRDGPGARGGADPASGDGGVAVGVQGADGGVSLGRTG